MIRQLIASLCLSSALGAAPQTPEIAADPSSTQRNAAVMRLDGEEIRWDEYSHWLIENFGARLATGFAGDHLVQCEAQRRGVEATPAEIEAELEAELKTRIDGAFLGSKAGWLAELERTQRSEAGIRTQRRAELGIDL